MALPKPLAVIRTRAAAFGFEVVVGDPLRDLAGTDVFGALLHLGSLVLRALAAESGRNGIDRERLKKEFRHLT
jgi:hypothetical protein